MKVVIAGFYNNIYACETARLCADAGLPIAAFVFQGDTLRELNERVRQERTPSLVAPRITDIEDLEIPCHFVKDLNAPASVELFRHLAPDVILQGMGPIFRQALIDVPAIGILNSHPGLLPRYQGCGAVEWSVYNDDPVGSTCHFIDAGIDTGPVVCSSTFDVYRGETYEDLRTRSFHHEAETLVAGLRLVAQGFRLQDATPQVGGVYHKTPSDEILRAVREKLCLGTYRHLKDRPS